MLIYIKKRFKNINNKNIVYKENKIYEVSEERYKEILKNFGKDAKFYLRKATKQEQDMFEKSFKEDDSTLTEKEIITNSNEDSERND